MNGSNRRPSPSDIVARLAKQEREASKGVILAPVRPGAKVRVRISGVIWELEVVDRPYTGWALLRVTAPGRAAIAGVPTPRQIREYLALFPRVRLVLLERQQDTWWAVPAQQNDRRFKIRTAVPIQLVDQGAPFETVHSRFDGQLFLFDSKDRRRNPSIAARLRLALEADVLPDEVKVPGAVPQEKRAFRILWQLRNPERRQSASPITDDRADRSDNDRLRRALQHSGARLDAFWYVEPELLAVRFESQEETHTVTINPDLTVVSSGICLNGEDARFDLTSLVGVFRELKNREED